MHLPRLCDQRHILESIKQHQIVIDARPVGYQLLGTWDIKVEVNIIHFFGFLLQR